MESNKSKLVDEIVLCCVQYNFFFSSESTYGRNECLEIMLVPLIGQVFPGNVFKADFWKRSSSGGLQHAMMSATGLAEG